MMPTSDAALNLPIRYISCGMYWLIALSLYAAVVSGTVACYHSNRSLSSQNVSCCCVRYSSAPYKIYDHPHFFKNNCKCKCKRKRKRRKSTLTFSTYNYLKKTLRHSSDRKDTKLFLNRKQETTKRFSA